MYIKTCLLIRIVSASLSESYSNVSCILIVYVRKKIISNVKMKNCNEMEEKCDIIFVVIILIKTYFWLPIYLRSQKYINKSWFIESCSIQTLSFLFTQKYNSIYLYIIAIYFNKLRQGYQRSKIQKKPKSEFFIVGWTIFKGCFHSRQRFWYKSTAIFFGSYFTVVVQRGSCAVIMKDFIT